MKQPRVLKPGMRGADVWAVKRALRKWGNTSGHPTDIKPLNVNYLYGQTTIDAVKAFQMYHSIKREPNQVGPVTFDLLEPYFDKLGEVTMKAAVIRYAPLVSSKPLSVMGQIIGWPYVGTHADFGNWESDNAQDVSARTGTPVLAVRAGTIGPQIGPLQTGGDPALLGLRLHLVTATNEFYYAHLSSLDVWAGQTVQAGQRLGLSGSANGVEHLHFASHHGDPGTYTGTPSPGYADRNYPG